MTITQLIDYLRAQYAEHGDIPILDGKGYDLHFSAIELRMVDDWEHSTPTDDGYEIPGTMPAVHIGRRF